MAQYFHLNVYKSSFDLLVKVTQLTAHFQRDFRYTIGEKLNSSLVEFIVVIYRANSARTAERTKFIEELIDRLQYINIMLRLSCELKNISKDRYIELTVMSQDVEKQLNGWLSYSVRGPKVLNEAG